MSTAESGYDALTDLVFEPFARTDLAAINAALQIDLASSFQLPTEVATRILRQARIRIHERHHYVQHATTSYGLLVHRLRRVRLRFGASVLNAYIEATGDVLSLPTLVALNLVDRSRVLTHLRRSGVSGEEASHLAIWNSADEITTALTYGNLPFDYIRTHWDTLRATVFTWNLIGATRAVAPALRTELEHPGRSAHDEYFSGTDFLEGGARCADLDLAGTAQLRGAALDVWLHDRSLRAVSTVIAKLGTSWSHPVTRLLFDLPLMFTTDSELTGGTASEVLWEHFHPGLVFEAWLDAVAGSPIPKNMSTTDAYDLLLERAPDWVSERLARTQAACLSLPDAFATIDTRRRLTYEPDDASGAGAEVSFEIATRQAALRLRGEAPLIFACGEFELVDASELLLSQVRQPPIVVTSEGVDTYPVVDGDPSGHLPLVALALWRYSVNGLIETGSTETGQRLLRGVAASYKERSIREAFAWLWHRLFEPVPALETLFNTENALLEDTTW